MQRQNNKEKSEQAAGVSGPAIQSGHRGPGEIKILDLRKQKEKKQAANSEPIYIPLEEEKFEFEIRDIVRIKPKDFAAFKNSYIEWVSKWQ